MAIKELKGPHLVRTLLDLYWINKNPNSDRNIFLKNSTSSQSNTYVKNYLLIDFYEWLYQVDNNKELSKEVEEWEFIKTSLPKYKELIDTTNYSLDALERNAQTIEDFLSYDFLEDLIQMYEIFMREMEKIQLMFFKIYVVNNSTNPVALIPWSYGLNRMCKDLYIIEEIKDDRKELVFNPDKKEGLNNKYSITRKTPTDKTKRVITDTPLKLFFYNVDYTTEDLLPRPWAELFETKIVPGKSGYPSRVELVKGLYSQYAFYGRQQIEGSTTPKIGLINYPFYLDGAEITSKTIKKSDNTSNGIEDNLLGVDGMSIEEQRKASDTPDRYIFIDIKDTLHEKTVNTDMIYHTD